MAAVLVLGALTLWWVTPLRAANRPTHGRRWPPKDAYRRALFRGEYVPNTNSDYLASRPYRRPKSRTLGSVKGLSVVSQGGVAQYRAGTVARDSIARALKVGTLVTGSLEPAEAR